VLRSTNDAKGFIDERVLSMSRICLCRYSEALLGSRFSSESRLALSDEVSVPFFGLLSSKTAFIIGPWSDGPAHGPHTGGNKISRKYVPLPHI